MSLTAFVLSSCARVRSTANMTVSARAAHTPVAPSTYSAVQSFHNTRLSHQLANSFFNLLTAHNLSDTQPWQTSGACRSSRPCQPKSSALAAKNPQPKPAAAAKTSLTAQLSASKPTGLLTRSSAVRSRSSFSVLRLANAAWSLSFLARPSRGSCGQPW